METLQETQPLEVLNTAAAQELALIPANVRDGLKPTERTGRQLMLPEQATPEQVAAAMDGVAEPKEASQERWQDFKDGKSEAAAESDQQAKKRTSIISYAGRQVLRIFK